MKCAIVTFHRAINYGGVLQAYALQQAISKIGVGAEILDYYCPSIERLYRPKIKDIFNKNTLKRYIAAILRNGIVSFNNKDFEKFRTQYLRLSPKKYRTRKDLKNCDYDVYITGSDQIWSYYCADFDKTYFLDFVNDTKKKYSYAASFGVGEIPFELYDEYRKYLRDFNTISVREQDGAKIIKNILDKEVPVLPDPTMLLDKYDWEKILHCKTEYKEKYILVYMVSCDQEIIDSAIELSESSGLKVYYINDAIYNKKNVVNLRQTSPEKWVELFMNAEYIFTNSFHGIAFSINFKKKFYVRKLKSNTGVNSRIDGIINLFNLTDRYDFENVCSEIDWTGVDAVLECEREKGYTYLKGILQGER